MDKLVYSAATGARALMHRQEVVANNLANASTTGFRADLAAFRAVPVRQDGTATTRVYALEATAGFDATPGPVQQTGRNLDVALRGPGFIAVQGDDGTETYTRNGDFEVDAQNQLVTRSGRPVLSDGGPVQIPAGARVSIGSDGTVTATVPGQAAQQAGRIKLVNPEAGALEKGPDGLLRMRGGNPADADPAVRLVDGALEGSNVNVVESMVGMIALARQFEMQMQMMKNAEQNAQRAQILLTGN